MAAAMAPAGGTVAAALLLFGVAPSVAAAIAAAVVSYVFTAGVANIAAATIATAAARSAQPDSSERHHPRD